MFIIVTEYDQSMWDSTPIMNQVIDDTVGLAGVVQTVSNTSVLCPDIVIDTTSPYTGQKKLRSLNIVNNMTLNNYLTASSDLTYTHSILNHTVGHMRVNQTRCITLSFSISKAISGS